MDTTLRQIFDGLVRKSDKWEPYFEVYERYLSKYIGRPISLIEVGVQGGGSLEMWRKYLGLQADIIGIDVDPSVKRNIPEDATFICGDQGDTAFWDSFLKQVGRIEVFIDDGGHHMEQQLLTFNKIWPHIADDGVYICEDTHTSYWPLFGGGLGKQGTFHEAMKGLVDIINSEHVREYRSKTKTEIDFARLTSDVKSIAFYNSMVVIEKGKPEFKRIIVNDQT